MDVFEFGNTHGGARNTSLRFTVGERTDSGDTSYFEGEIESVRQSHKWDEPCLPGCPGTKFDTSSRDIRFRKVGSEISWTEPFLWWNVPGAEEFTTLGFDSYAPGDSIFGYLCRTDPCPAGYDSSQHVYIVRPNEPFLGYDSTVRVRGLWGSTNLNYAKGTGLVQFHMDGSDETWTLWDSSRKPVANAARPKRNQSAHVAPPKRSGFLRFGRWHDAAGREMHLRPPAR